MIISGDPCNVRTCGVMQQRRIFSKSNLLQISSWILFVSTTREKKTEKNLEKEPTTSATNGLCRFWDWSSKHVNSFLDMEEICNMNKDGASGGSTCWKNSKWSVQNRQRREQRTARQNAKTVQPANVDRPVGQCIVLLLFLVLFPSFSSFWHRCELRSKRLPTCEWDATLVA